MTTILDRGQELDLGRDLGVGAARLIAAPMTTAPPTDLSDMIYMDTASNANEVQSLVTSGTPAGGTFKLRFRGYVTSTIAYNASAADVQTALQALAPIGSGGVVCTGGPLPSAVVITFSGSNLASTNVPIITVVSPALTGGTTPAAAVTVTTAGVGIYEVKNGWFDLGPTVGGITFTYNNTEQTYTVDQINADIFTLPNGSEMGVSAALSRTDLDTLRILMEGGSITTLGSGNRLMGIGTFSAYTLRRLAILSQRPSLDGGTTAGKIQAVFFRQIQRQPGEVSFVYQKEGAQRAPTLNSKVLADTTIMDERLRFGYVIDEV